MSAYICDKRHIIYLVEAAMHPRIRKPRLGAFSYYYNGERHYLSPGDYERAADVANMLWRENIASVSHRYPGESSATLPGPIGEDFNITARDFARERFHTFEPPQVFMSIDCYSYQSCEHDEWKDSEAFAFCDSLRKAACCACVGYDDAAWGAPELPKRYAA